MKFNFYIPEKLKGISPLIWEVTTDQHSNWMFLPEFNIDLAFNLGTPWTIQSNYYKNRSFNPTENFCFLAGLHTKPLAVEFNQCHLFGIRLNTIAANLLFGIQCKDLKNWSVEGNVIFRGKYNYIEDSIRSISDFQTRARWLESFILSSITDEPDLSLAMKITSVLDEITITKLQGKFSKIEDYTGYSRMHTLRIFQKWLGTSPSEALAFKRFESALNQIHFSSENLTQIGLNCGYYDQAHFIHGFKRFAQMTPKEYSNQKSDMVGQFSP
jgi:AraC-like DNA-binding protein